MSREEVAGPAEGPQAPFPIQLQGKVVKGFGRGSKELGIPTANIPIEGLDIGGHSDLKSGIYYGWAGLFLPTATDDPSKASAPPDPSQEDPETGGKVKDIAHKVVEKITGGNKDPLDATKLKVEDPLAPIKIYPTVTSIGYNPFYNNERRSVEVHVMAEFEGEFYNALMNMSILGFIREEKNYDSKEALIDDIKTDIEVSRRSLDRPAYQARKEDPFLTDFSWGPKGHILRLKETEKAKEIGIIPQDEIGVVGKLGEESDMKVPPGE